jgi:hypothetical protein
MTQMGNLRGHDRKLRNPFKSWDYTHPPVAAGILILYRDDYFSRCPNCSQLSKWQFAENVIPWNEVGHLAGWAD